MKKIATERNDIAFFIKLAPLTSDPKAVKEIRNIVCSRSLEVLEAAMQKKPVPEADCPAKEVDESMRFLDANGIQGFPAIVFSDGSVNEGYLDSAALLARVAEAQAAVTKGTAKAPAGAAKETAKVPAKEQTAAPARPPKK